MGIICSHLPTNNWATAHPVHLPQFSKSIPHTRMQSVMWVGEIRKSYTVFISTILSVKLVRLNHKSNMMALTRFSFSQEAQWAALQQLYHTLIPKLQTTPGGFLHSCTSVGSSTKRKKKQHRGQQLSQLEEESVAINHVKSYDTILPLRQKSNTVHEYLLSCRPIRLPPNYLKNREHYSSNQSWYSVNLMVAHK